MEKNMTPEDLHRLEAFISACKENPSLLHLPSLTFFKDYLASLGATVPPSKSSTTSSSSSTPPPQPKDEPMRDPNPESEPEEEESDVELDSEGVIEPEKEDPPELGDPDKIASEEDMEASQEKRSEAMAAMADGDLQKAVNLFTEAIKLNPESALLYAKRASILLKQKRVKAAIRDCNEALKHNPDSAAAHKFRGRANRLLGNWLEAAKDLRTACKLDFDEQTDEWLKEVQPNATKLEEHNRKYERQRKDKELLEKRDRIRKAQEEAKKAQEKQKAEGSSFSFPGAGEPGGGFPGSAGLGNIFNDPEIMSAMQDPEVAAAFQDVSSNPSNIFKYQSNPKVAAVINKLITKLGGQEGGMPGEMPSGFPGMGGFPGGGAGFPGGASGSPTPPGTGDSTGSSQPTNTGDDLD